MKTMSLALWLSWGAALILAGCSDGAAPIAGPDGKVVPATTSAGIHAKMGEDVHSVTGSGHWNSVPREIKILNRITYSAIRHADGKVSGEVEFTYAEGASKDREIGFDFHAKVTDLKVEGNIAKIEFMFTRGTYGGVPLADYYGGDLSGVRAWMVAIDNGEGSHATSPDISSGILWGDDSELETYLGRDVGWISSLGAEDFIDYMTTEALPILGYSPEAFFHPAGDGSVQVR